MAQIVTLNSTTGTFPLDIWVCDNCTSTATCLYIGTTSTLPYDFTLPSFFEESPSYTIKVIDNNECEYCFTSSSFKEFMDDEIFTFMDDTPYEFQ